MLSFSYNKFCPGYFWSALVFIFSPYNRNVFMLHDIMESFHVKSTQVTTRPLQKWMIFCEIVVSIEISISAKFYCFMATRFLAVDIKSCQKTHFFSTSCLRKGGITSARIEIQSLFYVHFKANEMPFPVTYCTNIFSTVMYPRSSNLTFDLVFLKMRYFNSLKKMCCVHVTII
jgi:hypothetical protein